MTTTAQRPLGASARSRSASRVRLQRAGGPLHPEDHPGDHRDGDEREEAADKLLRLEGQRVGAEGEHRADDEREHDGERDADPEPRQHVAATQPRQVGDQDADDESRFQAFTKADEEGREHVDPSESGWGDEVRLT